MTGSNISCAHCAAPIAASGRRPADPDTPRFCVRPGCQAARQAAYRRRIREADDSLHLLQEVRPCSGCGTALPARQGRVTDLPLGRWCPKRSCQRDRRDKQEFMEMFQQSLTSEGGATFEQRAELHRMFMDATRRLKHKCPKCFLMSPAGFKHPTMEGISCDGLGGMPVEIRFLRETYPERFPPE